MAGLEFRYSYRNAPTLKRFAQCNAFIRGLMGPFRSGKSSASVVEIVQRAQAMPPSIDGVRRSRWLVVRNTFGQLEDTTIKTFHQWLPPEHFGEYRATKHEYRILGFAGVDIEVMFRALDRPDHVKNLLSLEVTGAWVNEAREVPWSIIDGIQGRVGQFPSKGNITAPYWFGMWMDTNPPDEDSNWYRFFEEEKHDPSFAKLFKQPSGMSDAAENCENLNAGRTYYTNLATGKSAEWQKVYIHGRYGFVVEGKAVYVADYFDEMHCSENAEPSPGLPIYRGWDFGLTPACVFAQLHPGGRLIIFDELNATSMGIDRFSEEVLEHCATSFRGEVEFIDIGDPAGTVRAQTDERSCFEIMQAKGIMVEPGLQTPTIRIESVRKPLNTIRMGKPQLQLHPRCRLLRKGFMGGYQYRRLKTAAERFTDAPEKNQFSHPHDALQYICTILFGASLVEPKQPSRLDSDEISLMVDPTRSDVTGY